MLSFTNMRGMVLSPTVRVYAPCAALAFLICLLATQSAKAETFIVTRTDDRNLACISGTDCSLREAAALAGVDQSDNTTITFAIPASDPGCVSGVCTITLTLGEISLTQRNLLGNEITITNPTGADKLLISGNNIGRVFYVNTNATISGVTITKGNGAGTNGTGEGGGILVNAGFLTLTDTSVSGNSGTSGGGISGGTLTLNNSTISGNTASRIGGGIVSFHTITLNNSIVSGNTAGLNGGGVFNIFITNVTNSTISGNLATQNGGGIYSAGGEMNLTDSTISGNTAGLNGGGIVNSMPRFDPSTLNLTDVTVTGNKSNDPSCVACAGGISNTNNSSTVNMKNTIVAGNSVANASSAPDFLGAVAAESVYNLIGIGFGMTGIVNGDAGGNQAGSSAIPIDPKLDPVLRLNGGTTPNHALLAGSPAIDQGNSSGTDQRGAARPFDNPNIANAAGGNGADIGAFEMQAAPTAATVSIGGRVLTASGRGIKNARLSLTDSDGRVRTATTTAFGYYRFDDVRAGETFILAAASKRYTFGQPQQVLNIYQATNGINFVAVSEDNWGFFNRNQVNRIRQP